VGVSSAVISHSQLSNRTVPALTSLWELWKNYWHLLQARSEMSEMTRVKRNDMHKPKTNRGDVGSGDVGGLWRRTKQRPTLRRQLLKVICPTTTYPDGKNLIPDAAYHSIWYLHLRTSKVDINRFLCSTNVNSFISKDAVLRLLGAHDRRITCVFASHSLVRGQIQSPRSRQLGYRQFPGENVRSNLTVGSTHLGCAMTSLQ